MATSASRRLPGWAFVVFAVVTSLIVSVTVTTAWLHRTTLDTDHFVDTVAPVIDDPQVQEALGAWVARELVAVVDVQGLLEEVLPERGQLLAPVITNAVQGFLGEEAAKFIGSDTFQELWTAALTRAHGAAVKVLRGGGDVVSVKDGKVVLNLVPILNQVLINVEDRVSGIVGRDVNLPEIGADESPSEAIQKLQDALGTSVEIPDDFGQIEVFDSDTLGILQTSVEWFDKGYVVLIVLSVVLLALTLWLAPDRRKAVLWLAAGIAVTTVVFRRMVFATHKEILGQVRIESNKGAVQSILDQVFGSYLDVTLTVIVLCIIAWLAAFVFGPAKLAVALRGGVSKAGAFSADKADDVAWVRQNVLTLRIGVLVVAGLVVLFGTLSFVGLLLVGLVVAAAEIWLGLLDTNPPAPSEPK